MARSKMSVYTTLHTGILICLMSYALCLKQPHVLLVVADDLGWNDVGYHHSEILTPTIDKLAAGGVKLENYYIQPICSPSRSQLLSGRYQIHTGMQHSYIWRAQPKGHPLSDKTIADQLKASGYATHMVGKWHLGFFKKEYTPTYRGFDSYFGYLSGSEDYYTHSACMSNGLESINCRSKAEDLTPDESTSRDCGVDLHDNENVVWNNTEYSTHLFARKAENIIRKHDQSKSLFLYLPFQSVHSPLQVPAKYSDMYKHIKNHNRRMYAGMVTCMDEAIHNVTSALRDVGMWEDTIVIFTTDNGGEVFAGGNNWPLRGFKHTLWEGGMRGVGFVHASSLNDHMKGKESHELMHISDWFPTLLHLAGSNASTALLDGYNVWNTINNGLASPRKELLHNIDILFPLKGDKLYPDKFDTRVRAAIRQGDWKLITGNPCNGDWFPPPHEEFGHEDDVSDDNQNVWLFNIKQDPYERKDLHKVRPDIVSVLLDRLTAYNATAVEPWCPPVDKNAAPSHNGGAWVPWM